MSRPALRFLADECCDFSVVRALRGIGLDVRAVGEEVSRSVDADVIAEAARDGRILLTEDKDFGWLAFVAHADSAGVILIRFPGNARQTLAQTLLQLLSEHEDQLLGAFVVVQPGQVRITNRSR